MYILAGTTIDEDGDYIDAWVVHEDLETAQAALVKTRERDDCWTATVACVVESTDYTPAHP